MLQYDFEESVGYWMTMGARAYQKALNDEVGPRGITWRQCQVLGCLALEGELSQIELADRMAIEGPTLVGILDRMQRSGWIGRHDCPSDRRKKIVRATEQAQPVWAEIAASGRRIRQRATIGLDAAEVAELKRLLSVVQANLLQPSNATPTELAK